MIALSEELLGYLPFGGARRVRTALPARPEPPRGAGGAIDKPIGGSQDEPEAASPMAAPGVHPPSSMPAASAATSFATVAILTAAS